MRLHVSMDDDRVLSCPQPWRAADGSPRPSGTPTGAPVTVDDEAGTGLLLPSRQVRVAAGVILIVIGAGLGVAGGLMITHGVAATLGGVVLGVLGLLLLAAGAFSLRRKHHTTGILLTPEQVVLNWVHPAIRLPWQDITEIRPLGLRVGRARTSLSHNYLGVVTRDHDSGNVRMRKVASKFGKDLACALPMRTIDVDQLVVLHTVTFYLDNPDARAELAGPDAVLRVREVRL
jgi:hypothetical protein